MTLVLPFLLACLPLKRAFPAAEADPMGILTLLERSSEDIKYVGQGGCQSEKTARHYRREPARLMFFESEVGSLIATVSCSQKDIYYLEIHPKKSPLYLKLHYGEWGIVGYAKRDGEWTDVCEHSECAQFLSPEEQELWRKDYQKFNDILKATYILRSRVPIPK
jgi:hypothetical protein